MVILFCHDYKLACLCIAVTIRLVGTYLIGMRIVMTDLSFLNENIYHLSISCQKCTKNVSFNTLYEYIIFHAHRACIKSS